MGFLPCGGLLILKLVLLLQLVLLFNYCLLGCVYFEFAKMRLNVGKLLYASQYFRTLSSYENNKNNINISVPSLLPCSVKKS